MLFDKKCSAPLLLQPLPERGACGVGTLAVEKVHPAPVALVAVQGAQAVTVQRFLKKGKAARNRSIPGCFGCRWWGSNPVQNFSGENPAYISNVLPLNSEIHFSGKETVNTVREIETCYKMCYFSRLSGSRTLLRTLSRSAAVCTSSP